MVFLEVLSVLSFVSGSRPIACTHTENLPAALQDRNGTTVYALAGRRVVACSYADDSEAKSLLLNDFSKLKTTLNRTNTVIEVPDGSTLFLLKDSVPATPITAIKGEVWRHGRVSLRLTEDEAVGLNVEGPSPNYYAKKVALSVVPRIRTAAAAAAGAPSAARAECADSIKLNLANNVDESLYRKVLNDLSGAASFELNGRPTTIKTRATGTAGNSEAADHLANLCNAMGYDAEEQVFSVRGTPAKNVVCIKRGNSNKIVVVGGHFDSTSPSASTNAPGAIDNGSGSVGVLAIASAVASSKLQFDATVHFVFFGGEEQGLYGSKHYVSEASKNGDVIETALVMDMIGYSSKFYGVTVEGTNNAAVRKLMEEAEEDYLAIVPKLDVGTTTVSFGSDHVPFQQAGVPCYLAIEMDDTDYPGYHKTSDTVAYMNWGQAIDILKGMAGTLCRRAVLA